MRKKNKLYLSGFFVLVSVSILFALQIKKVNEPIAFSKHENFDLIQSKSLERHSEEISKEIAANENYKIAKVNSDRKLKLRNPSFEKKFEVTNLISNEYFEGTQWKIWYDVRAKLPQNVSSSDQIISKVANFVIVKSENEEANLSEFNKDLLYVVYDSRLKKAGIVTGAIKVVTDRKDLLEESLRNSDAKISQSFELIQTYFIENEKKLFNFQELYVFLKTQSYVKDIEIDISDRSYEKK